MKVIDVEINYSGQSRQIVAININGEPMKEFEPIKNKPISEWFTAINDRSGWRGLIEEIKQVLRCDDPKLNFCFYGDEKYKQEFKNYILKMGYSCQNISLSPEEIISKNLENARVYKCKERHQKAINCYKEAAEYGSCEAQYEFAEYNYKIYNGEIEITKSDEDAVYDAVENYTKAAEQGHRNSQWRLYKIFSEGKMIKKDDSKAIKWLKKLSSIPDEKACFYLADYYYNGTGIEKNYQEAFRLYKIASEKEISDAQYKLAGFYEEGNCVKKDFSMAFEWYEKAAKLGNPKAMYQTAEFYRKGLAGERNYNEAFEWYSNAVNNGCNEALYSLAVCYEKGYGTEKDYATAFEYFKKLEGLENASAIYKIGEFYEQGLHVEQDIYKAYEYYKKAADSNNPSGKACFKMGEQLESAYNESLDESKMKSRTIKIISGTASVGMALKLPGYTKLLAIPTLIIPTLFNKSSKKVKKEFLNSEVGEEMKKYFRKGEQAGNEECAKKLSEWELK